MALIILPQFSYQIESHGFSLDLEIGDAGGTYGLHRTGQVIWDGSIHLSKLLEYNPPLNLAECKILELGSGCAALPSQVAAVLGARVTVTDLEEEIPSLTRNIQRNSDIHYHPVSIVPLDWKQVALDNSFPSCLNPMNFDIVLCSDLVYELTLHSLIHTLLLFFYHNPHLLILMSNTNRKHVHLFRRRMIEFCFIEDISYPNFHSTNNILWILKFREEPNWDKIWTSIASLQT